MKEPTEYSGGGSRIYRHQAPASKPQLSFGDSALIGEISDHIERCVGPVESVFHELISPRVHLDVHWVKPGEGRPFHTLVTSGMSEAPMSVPGGASIPAHSELYCLLPPTWPISSETGAKPGWLGPPESYWPVRYLKYLARLPHEYNTWLGPGHTVPNGDPAEPLDPSVGFCGSMILPPFTLDKSFAVLQIPRGRTIGFQPYVPLYPEEMTLKLNKGASALLDRWDRLQIDPVDLFKPGRPNGGKRKLFGFFG